MLSVGTLPDAAANEATNNILQQLIDRYGSARSRVGVSRRKHAVVSSTRGRVRLLPGTHKVGDVRIVVDPVLERCLSSRVVTSGSNSSGPSASG